MRSARKYFINQGCQSSLMYGLTAGWLMIVKIEDYLSKIIELTTFPLIFEWITEQCEAYKSMWDIAGTCKYSAPVGIPPCIRMPSPHPLPIHLDEIASDDLFVIGWESFSIRLVCMLSMMYRWLYFIWWCFLQKLCICVDLYTYILNERSYRSF